jgi:hypothetical protein
MCCVLFSLQEKVLNIFWPQVREYLKTHALLHCRGWGAVSQFCIIFDKSNHNSSFSAALAQLTIANCVQLCRRVPSVPSHIYNCELCARSFRQYHGQRISHAIVMTDALNIHDGILKLKKMVLQRRAA